MGQNMRMKMKGIKPQGVQTYIIYIYMSNYFIKLSHLISATQATNNIVNHDNKKVYIRNFSLAL
jgi:hypothetical protein